MEAPAPKPENAAVAAEPSSAAVEAAAQAPVGFARKGARNRGNIRKRPTADEGGSGDEEDATKVVRKAKTVRGEPLTFTNKQEGAEEVHVTYESNKAIQSGKDNLATRELETETATDRDAR